MRGLSPTDGADIKVYVENAGEFIVPLSAMESVRLPKVVLNRDQLEPRLREAI